MTTPTTTQDTSKITATEIREQLREIKAMQLVNHDEFEMLRVQVEAMREQIETMRGGLQTAATPPAAGQFAEMIIDSIIMTYDDAGKPAYKAKGAPYTKHGVRIWDEVFPNLGIDPATLKPGPNEIEPIRARVLMNPPQEDGKTAQPRKVTGKA